MLTRIFDPAPDGYFVDGLIVFNHLGRGGYVSKGFALEFPDFRQASAAVLNQLQNQLRLFFRTPGDDLRWQFHYFDDPDYHSELDRFDRETDQTNNEWVRFCRKEVVERCRAKAMWGVLSRQRLVVFVSRKLNQCPPLVCSRRSLENHYRGVLGQVSEEFNLFGNTLQSILGGLGVRVIPLTDAGHFKLYFRFFNPSLVDRSGFDPITTFDPERSIQENCWLCEAVARDSEFWLDSRTHAFAVLTRWARSAHPGIIYPVAALKDIHITLNIVPVPVQDEIRRLEKLYARVQGQYQSEGKPSLLTELETIKEKCRSLMDKSLRSFQVQFLVRTWGRTPEELAARYAALQQAINSMDGAQCFRPALPSSLKRFFYQSFPGFPWGRYNHRQLPAEDSFLADFVPLPTTSPGYLPQAEAIFEGPQDSLVGVKTHASSATGSSPQHGALFGGTGSGKSMLASSLITQMSPYYVLIILIDSGGSYEVLVPLLDPSARPIRLRPNGNVTVNYNDTLGMPVSPQHIANGSALLSTMAGRCADEEALRLRRAFFTRYLYRLYDNSFTQWERKQPIQVLELARLGCALERRRLQNPDHGLQDAYVDFRDWRLGAPDEANAFLEQFTEGEVVQFLKTPQTRQIVRNLAFTRFAPHEYPTHQMLQELMLLDASAADRSQAKHLADLLSPWRRDGAYGALLDGHTNVRLDGQVLCLELGEIPDSDDALKSCAVFLARQLGWQRALTMPRSDPKLMVFEEAPAFLRTPGSGAADLIQQCYQQARKYNTCLLSVYQEYGSLHASPICSAVMNNSQVFFLLKQNHPDDLILLGRDLGLSPTAMDAIRNYPKPEQAGFAAFTYFHRDTPQPVCATAYHRPSREMLYVSRTDGPHVDRRRRALEGTTNNLVQRIKTLAASNPTE